MVDSFRCTTSGSAFETFGESGSDVERDSWVENEPDGSVDFSITLGIVEPAFGVDAAEMIG